jgi:DUF1680 family protein
MVYCLEDVDNPCRVDQVAIPKDAAFETEFQSDLLGGVTVVKTKGRHEAIVETEDGFRTGGREVPLAAIPYYAWDNRDGGRMVVWVPAKVPNMVNPEGATR